MAGIGEITDEHAKYLPVRQGLARAAAESAAGDAAGGAIVGLEQRRAGQRVDKRQRGDAGGTKAAGDLGIGIGIGVD